MVRKLFLNQARNLESDKSNTTIPIDVNTNKDIIVDDNFNEVINQYNVYLDEREQCTTVRLSAKVNIVASNVIFNSVTEIVKDEGSSNCKCLNFASTKISTTIGKPENYPWGGENICDAVMDTQISYSGDDKKNYTYLCGFDILNNHILRSKIKYPVVDPGSDREQDFNTISDWARDEFGKKENKFWGYYKQQESEEYEKKENEHRYTKSNIMTFDESLINNFVNNDGWLGFYNKGLMISNKVLGLENVINNETRNKFIDLFPGRDRYSFLPHYNKYRKRYEKNWEYCLTYPCENTTTGIPFINESLNTLKIAFIDESEADDDGVYRCKIYTVSKHGLKPDDIINLYRSEEISGSASEIVEENLIVDDVIDDYVFTVYTSDWVCKKWLSVFDKDAFDVYGVKHIGGIVYEANGKRMLSVNNYLNIDFDKDGEIGSQNLSFAKVVDGIQCKYYVRIFSRFPNFDFYDGELTEENIYSIDPVEEKSVIDIYSKLEYEKQSTQTRLGFSRNAYGDNIGQIVYNDDIDISLIKDNLGRPLTSLYLSFFKTNYGHEEWYGKGDEVNHVNPKPGDAKVEWSRCFGKLNCGFEYSPYIDEVRWGVGNIRVMNNVNDTFGLTEDAFRKDSGDEIVYKQQDKFYGDLCMYSPSECLETVIQECCHRFNTMQREIGGDTNQNYYYTSCNLFNTTYYDDIEIDDYTSPSKAFKVQRNEYDRDANRHPEGYFYCPNYEIPVRSFSPRMSEFNPKMLDVVEFIEGESGNTIARTSVSNYFNKGTDLYLYDTETGIDYQCDILNILDINVVEFKCEGYQDTMEPGRHQLYAKNVLIPSYAEIIPGRTGSYRWRELVQNGFEETEGIIEEYPFVNGCLYINRDINLFLRRQDPFGDYGLSSSSIYFGLEQVTGERNPVENGTAANANDAIKESNIKC